MKRPVRTGVPPRVTSLTSTTPRLVVTSRRRPARVASITNVWTPWPVSTTASTRSPLMDGIVPPRRQPSGCGDGRWGGRGRWRRGRVGRQIGRRRLLDPISGQLAVDQVQPVAGAGRDAAALRGVRRGIGRQRDRLAADDGALIV